MDDIILTANSPAKLLRIINMLHASSKEVGLKMNIANTKVMYYELIDSRHKNQQYKSGINRRIHLRGTFDIHIWLSTSGAELKNKISIETINSSQVWYASISDEKEISSVHTSRNNGAMRVRNDQKESLKVRFSTQNQMSKIAINRTYSEKK